MWISWHSANILLAYIKSILHVKYNLSFIDKLISMLLITTENAYKFTVRRLQWKSMAYDIPKGVKAKIWSLYFC